MQRDMSPHGYDLLTRLRRLETRIGRLQERWESFRADPHPEQLEDFRVAFSGTGQALDELTKALGAGHVAASDESVTADARPMSEDAVRFAPYRDSLTGIYSREGFDTLAGAELKRCRRYSRSFGLLLVEIHASNLSELRGATGTLQSLIRGYDLVGRYSDRRLAVGLPESDATETRRIAARLLRAMEEEGCGRTSVRRLSYARMPDDGVALASLVEAAEARLEK